MKRLPFLLFADTKGKIYSHPFLKMTAASAGAFCLPHKEELMKIPHGATLFYLPGRLPVGFNPVSGHNEIVETFEGKKVFAVAAFLIPAYVRLYNPAFIIKQKQTLPLWAYTACGFYGGSFFVAARRIDRRIRQSPRFYNKNEVSQGVKEFLKQSPCNRLYQHLAHCALNYNCLAAKNFFLRRWEAPIPTSRTCNARCIGCLSYQDSECVSSHQRIQFAPSREEIAGLIVSHLKTANEAIVSFGQGCEGEPLLEAGTIAQAIASARQKVTRGTINMNTNGSLPQKIKLLCQAGIDSFRVSVNSAQEKYYSRYFRPVHYRFRDVLHSIETAKKYKKFVSINVFVFPGFTDSPGEIKALGNMIRNYGIDMIQWRNLNIDPYSYCESLSLKQGGAFGILPLIKKFRRQFPSLKMGYFNLPKEQFKTFKNVM